MRICRLILGLATILALAGFTTDKLLSIQTGAAPPPPSGTAWSLTDNASTTITTTTATNDTAQVNNGGGYAGVRSNNSFTGKIYVEFSIVSVASSLYAEVGFCNSGTNLSAGPFCAQNDGNGVVVGRGNASTSIIFNSGASTGNGGELLDGNIEAIAYDSPNTIWTRSSSDGGSTWSDWNGSGSADPATGIGGGDLSGAPPTGPFFLLFQDWSQTATKVQLLCGANTKAAAPTGFTKC